MYMGDSRPFRPGCDLHYFFYLFILIQIYYGWPQKMTNFSASNGRNHREIRAVIDSFEVYTINSSMNKKIFF